MSPVLCSDYVDSCRVKDSNPQCLLSSLDTAMQPIPRCSPPYASRNGQSIRDFPVEFKPVVFVGQISPYCL